MESKVRKHMNLRNRLLKLEKIFRTRYRGGHDKSAEHDDLSGDHLLRYWEGGADDWVRVRIEQVIAKSEGMSAEAKASLQERLRILQTGDPLQVLLVIAGLRKHCPEWSSAREDEVIEKALKLNPAITQAVAEYGILRAGRKDWKAFAWWLERRVPREYGRDRAPEEDLGRPKVIDARFSLWVPPEHGPKDERGSPLACPLKANGSTGDAPP